MQRREFLKCASIAGCGLLLGERLDLIAAAEAAERPDLVVARGVGKSPALIAKSAIEAFGGMKRFISRGDIVVIKPNIGWDRTPEQAANTNPEVVAAIVKLCFDAGAKKVKVFDRSVNDPTEVLQTKRHCRCCIFTWRRGQLCRRQKIQRCLDKGTSSHIMALVRRCFRG